MKGKCESKLLCLTAEMRGEPENKAQEEDDEQAEPKTEPAVSPSPEAEAQRQKSPLQNGIKSEPVGIEQPNASSRQTSAELLQAASDAPSIPCR